MIRGVRKIPVLRYFLIVLLFSALFVSSLYLYLHYKKAKSLRTSIESLISEREKSSLIDSCIISLYSADNNSRLYTLTGDKKYLIEVIVHGSAKQDTTQGKIYQGQMPANPEITDKEIADVLTYVRNSFGNKASAVTADEVKKARGAN